MSAPKRASRIQRKELPPAKTLTAEVNSPGITCVKTYGFTFGSRTGRPEETAIHEEEPSEVYTRPSPVLRAPSAMQELSTPPQATFTLRGRPRASAAGALSVPMICVDGTIVGKRERGSPLAAMNWSEYVQPMRS